MKKLFASIVVFALLLTVLAGCQNVVAAQRETENTTPVAAGFLPEEELEPVPAFDPQPTEPAPVATQPPATQLEKRISRDEAIIIALNHAKLTKPEVWDLDAGLERENGVLIFEVDFEFGGYEYEYEILAETGDILRAHKEKD